MGERLVSLFSMLINSSFYPKMPMLDTCRYDHANFCGTSASDACNSVRPCLPNAAWIADVGTMILLLVSRPILHSSGFGDLIGLGYESGVISVLCNCVQNKGVFQGCATLHKQNSEKEKPCNRTHSVSFYRTFSRNSKMAA